MKLRVALAPVLLGLALSSISAQTKTGDVSIGTAFSFRSANVQGEIPVRVHLPPGYEGGASRHPVLYLLEIADDFPFASTTADFLAACGRVPGLIVVAVNVDKVAGPPPGLIAFVEKELFPWVEKTYRTEPRRILYGHSGRAFAALYVLMTRPELFEGYICPGLGLTWPVEPGRMDFSALASERLSAAKSLPKALVFSLGDEPRFQAGVERFMGVLKEKAPSDFRWEYLPMPGDDHSSTRLKTLYEGLEFVFKPSGSDTGLSGRWTGFADLTAEDGRTNRITLLAILEQAGTGLAGTLGPSEDVQFAIENGTVNGDAVSFRAAMPTRVYRMRLKGADGRRLEGEVTSEDGKVRGTIKLERAK